MQKVILYARVSTIDQNVKQQLNKLKEYAKNRNWKIVKSVADKESGRKELFERKKFKDLINNLKEGDTVLVYNIDRLTRNWKDQPKLESIFNNKCNLISMSDAVDLSNASGRLMFRIKMAIACYQVEDMFEKQKIGIERAKKEGKYTGGTKGRSWKWGDGKN